MNERKRDNLVVMIIITITIAFLIAIIIYAELSESRKNDNKNNPNKNLTVVYTDCLPDSIGNLSNKNETLCLDRGCLWQPSEIVGVPWCQYPNNSGGYSVKEKYPPYKFLLKKNKGPDLFGHHLDEIVVNVTVYSNYGLRILFYDPNNER